MKIIIGLSGVARAGKNLFADILEKQLKSKYKVSVEQMSLAKELKKDCEEFIKTKLGLDVWSNDTNEKNIFRPILVEYGNIKRAQTNGRYWVEKLAKTIRECKSDIILVSDIRYAHYPVDEVQWLKDEMKGILVHISKYEMVQIDRKQGDKELIKKVFISPPNEHEKINDPKVKAAANYRIEWEDRIHDGVTDLLNDTYLNQVVKEFIDSNSSVHTIL